MVGRMRGWVGAVFAVLGCGEVDNGSTTDAADPTSASSTDSSSSTGAPGCAGGPACGVDEVCVDVDEVCECEPGWEHCALVERTSGCVGAVPFDCMGVEDVAACHVALVCGSETGQIQGGVLTCNPPMECAGSCDSVEACQTAAGGDASASDEGASTD